MMNQNDGNQQGIRTTSGRDTSVMAFFLDVENLIAGASSLGLPLDLKPVIARLSRQGRIATRRCFGDINAACRAIQNEKVAHEVRHMLQRNLFVIEDIPHTTQRKNSADMRLIIEALSLAYTNETIGEFVILSSDRDYVPLALKLRELGRCVTTVAVSRENVNRMVIDASDTVLYYDDLVGPHYGRRLGRGGSTAGYAGRERDALVETSLKDLVEAVRAVEQSGKDATLVQVGSMLRRLRPDFDLESLGISTFKQFALLCVDRGLLVAATGAHPEDLRFSLPNSRPTLPLDPVARVPELAKLPSTALPYLANLTKCIAEATAEQKQASGARIVLMLQDAIPNYNLKAAGVDSFKKLVLMAEAAGLVLPTWNKGDFIMELGPQGYALMGIKPPAKSGDDSDGGSDDHSNNNSHEPGVAEITLDDQTADFLDSADLEGYNDQPEFFDSLATTDNFGNGLITELRSARFVDADPIRIIQADAEDYRSFITQQLKLQLPLPPVSEWEPVLRLAVESFGEPGVGDGSTLGEWKDRTLQNARTHGLRVGEVIVYKLLLSLRFAQCLVIQQAGYGQYDFRVTGFHKDPAEWADAILRNFGNQLIRLRGHTSMDPKAFAVAFIGDSEDDLVRAQRILDEI